ncbi:hypothetical protein HTZ84_11870 [Haloterrigena sp. SYSU A558-1]|uniref:Uncharacterized protein n=1 Tax=Haloterrigena gelatinilytica TaxID=2741724 RepID=A0ABX2L9R0_9EURY|nr:hypothetical protein [Haloterrigena gelatinilytica]NUC72999.1 hypothetical protein [Haloterrigena gelatinilytica]
MAKTPKEPPYSTDFPSEMRRPVFGDNKFQLPARLVREVGFKSSRLDPVQSAKVAWYYHEEHEKAVLANSTIDRPLLDLVGASALSGVSNEDLESGDVSGARVTIITDLPESLYERLITNSLVLKPLYAAKYAELNGTCVSVYPGGEYDQGSLPNVDQKRNPTNEDEAISHEASNVIGAYDMHANSI